MTEDQPAFSIADLPRDQQLVSLDGVLTQTDELVSSLERRTPRRMPIATIIHDVEIDLDNVDADLERLRTDDTDRSVKDRMTKSAALRARLTTFRQGEMQ